MVIAAKLILENLIRTFNTLSFKYLTKVALPAKMEV